MRLTVGEELHGGLRLVSCILMNERVAAEWKKAPAAACTQSQVSDPNFPQRPTNSSITPVYTLDPSESFSDNPFG